jgi:predicted deacetylase
MIKKNLILEYDDFHWKYPENCLKTIKKFIEIIPNIKISLFTTPKHSGYKLSSNKEWCEEVKNLINDKNITLGVHGLFHSIEEFKHLSREEAVNKIIDAENEFKECNLPFVKVFRGPHWGINQNTYDALIELNYTHVYTHEDYKSLAEKNTNIKNVIYNWNLKDAPQSNNLFLIGHGHTHNVCQNGIEETFERVAMFIKENDVEFKFINEYD